MAIDWAEFERSLSAEEAAARKQIHKILWVLYPRDENEDDLYSEKALAEDKLSQDNALMIVHGLRDAGLRLSMIKQ